MKKVKYGWRQCIKNYRFHSIFLKNLVLIFLLIMLPFVCILGLSYYGYGHIQKSEERAYTEELITRISMDVENVFREIRNKAIMLSADSDVELFYLAESIDKDYFYDVHNILKFLALYNLTTDVIDGVYVYAPYSDVVISEAGRYEYERFSDMECVDGWEDNGEMFQTKYLERTVAGKKKETIAFYYTTNYTGSRKGVAILNLSLEKLDNVFSYNEDVSLYIWGNNQLLYNSTAKNSDMELLDREELLKTEDGVIVASEKIDICDIEIIVRINSKPLEDTLQNIRIYIITFVGIMLIISVLFALYISRKIFDPFSEIMKALEDIPEAEEGQLLQNKDEVSYIMDSIYATISRNKDVEEELLERIKLLKKTQAVALQSQINPHFINNTLQVVNWMATGCLGENNDISEMLSSLSQLLRISLEDTDTFVTLKEEIAYVQKYLYIQQKRLGNSFKVNFQIPKELEPCKVIKMMLQPIVENALDYGIRPYGGMGELTIRATRDCDTVCISVQDSGIGIMLERVEEINQSIRKATIKESNHIGLSNVNQRIKLAFGENYGIKLESQIGLGTTVSLRLPYQM